MAQKGIIIEKIIISKGVLNHEKVNSNFFYNNH